jgi:hypothetical protein
MSKFNDIVRFHDMTEFEEIVADLPMAVTKKIHVEDSNKNMNPFEEYHNLRDEEEFWNKGNVAIVNERTNQLARVASSGYKILQHPHYFAKVAECCKTANQTSIKGYVRQTNGGNSVTVRLVFNDLFVEEPQKGMNIQVGAEFNNSYNFDYAARGAAYNLRISCTNQMVMRNLIKEWVFCRAHVAKSEEDLLDIVAGKTEEFFGELLTSQPKFKLAMENAIDTDVTFTDIRQIEALFKRMFEGKKHSENMADMVRRIAQPVGNEFTISKWDLYNVVTDYTTHDVEAPKMFDTMQYRAEKNILINPIEVPTMEEVKANLPAVVA